MAPFNVEDDVVAHENVLSEESVGLVLLFLHVELVYQLFYNIA